MTRTLEQFVQALDDNENAAVSRERWDALRSVLTYRWRMTIALLVALCAFQAGLFAMGYAGFACGAMVLGTVGIFFAEPERFARWRWQRPLTAQQQSALLQGPVRLAVMPKRTLYTADYMLCLRKLSLGQISSCQQEVTT